MICLSDSEHIKHMMLSQYGSCCFFWEAAPAFFFAKSPLVSIFAAFPILYVWEAAAAFFTPFPLYVC